MNKSWSNIEMEKNSHFTKLQSSNLPKKVLQSFIMPLQIRSLSGTLAGTLSLCWSGEAPVSIQ